MRNRKRKCDCCVSWTKMTFGDKHTAGLCDLWDLKCPGDYGCKSWAPKPYQRKENVQIKDLDS